MLFLITRYMCLANILINLNYFPINVIFTGHSYTMFQITDSVVASALNISCGKYSILDSDDRKLQWRPSSLGSIVSVQTAAESLQPHHLLAPASIISAEPSAKKPRMWNLEPENSKLDESQTDKSYLDSTNESEKPSDTSMSSDTPLDDIVKAELKNLANKSGLDDFVAPPAPPTSGNLSHTPVVDFVATTFPSSEQGADTHFPADLVMDMPSTTDSDTTGQMQASDPSPSSLPSKHQAENMHFQIASSTRLDLSGSSIDVNLDSHMEESTQELDFEALSEEFNRNTQS